MRSEEPMERTEVTVEIDPKTGAEYETETVYDEHGNITEISID